MRMLRLTGDPTKQDTARLADASQAQIQELLDAGYLPYSSDNLGRRKVRDQSVVKADRGFFASDEVSLEDVFQGVVNKPWMARELLLHGVAHNIDYDKMAVPSDFFKDFIESADKMFDDLQAKEGDAAYRSSGRTPSYRTAGKRLLAEIPKERQRILDYLKKGNVEAAMISVTNIGSDLKRFAREAAHQEYEDQYDIFGDERAKPSPRILKYAEEIEGLDKKVDEYEGKVSNLRDYHKGDLRGLVNLSHANPDVVDPDEYVELAKKGFNPPKLKGEYSFLDNAVANLKTGTQIPKALYNLAAGMYAENQALQPDTLATAPNDLGDSLTVTTPVVDPDDLYDIKNYSPDGKFTKVMGIYPTRKVHFGPFRTVSDYNREDTDAREDLDGSFYLDREAAGTGSVTNEDLVKTLFNESIDPNRRVQFYNKSLGDLVDVYLYDDPDMLKAAGKSESLVPKYVRYDEAAEEVDETAAEEPTTQEAPAAPVPVRPKDLEALRSLDARPLPTPKPQLASPAPLRIPTGRRVVPVGSLDQSRSGSRTGQKLEREYYYDPVLRKYQQRVVDEERKGGPVYGGSYSFAKGGVVNKYKK